MAYQPSPKAPKTLEQVIAYLETALADMRRDDTPNQLEGIEPDTAFELGYETAIFDLRHATDDIEVGVVEFAPVQTDAS